MHIIDTRITHCELPIPTIRRRRSLQPTHTTLYRPAKHHTLRIDTSSLSIICLISHIMWRHLNSSTYFHYQGLPFNCVVHLLAHIINNNNGLPPIAARLLQLLPHNWLNQTRRCRIFSNTRGPALVRLAELIFSRKNHMFNRFLQKTLRRSNSSCHSHRTTASTKYAQVATWSLWSGRLTITKSVTR